jgi:hypothetical protein
VGIDTTLGDRDLEDVALQLCLVEPEGERCPLAAWMVARAASKAVTEGESVADWGSSVSSTSVENTGGAEPRGSKPFTPEGRLLDSLS